MTLPEVARVFPFRASGFDERPRETGLELESPSEHRRIVLNGTASAIFALCDGLRSVSEIQLELERRFGLATGSLARDVHRTVEELLAPRADALERIAARGHCVHARRRAPPLSPLAPRGR